VRALALVVGLALAVLGFIALAAPSAVLDFGRFLSTSTGLYVAAAVRVLFGAVLLAAAPASRWPLALRVLGAVLLLAGVLTPVFGLDRSAAMIGWASDHRIVLRAWGVVALALGALVVTAVRRKPARA
jgi:hypothetical protein